MTDYVRVKDKQTGHEFSVPAHTFDGDAMTELDKPATDPGGELLPVKYKTTVNAAVDTKSGRAAAKDKE